MEWLGFIIRTSILLTYWMKVRKWNPINFDIFFLCRFKVPNSIYLLYERWPQPNRFIREVLNFFLKVLQKGKFSQRKPLSNWLNKVEVARCSILFSDSWLLPCLILAFVGIFPFQFKMLQRHSLPTLTFNCRLWGREVTSKSFRLLNTLLSPC